MSEELILNPYGKVVEVDDDQGVVGYRVFAPVRGRGLQSAVIGHREATRGTITVDPTLHGLLKQVLEADDELELSDDAVQRLHALGLLVEPDRVSTPVMYACPLDLGAIGALGDDEPTHDLVVNP